VNLSLAVIDEIPTCEISSHRDTGL